MENTNEIVLEIISEFLGEPRKSYPSKSQYGFDCIECDDDRHKGNMEVNIEKCVYHCWSCGESGNIPKLISKYGNKEHKKTYELIRPDITFTSNNVKQYSVKIPDSFKKFTDVSDQYPMKQQALSYLRSRGVTDQIINKYDMGFCDSGDHYGCIIVPSYNSYGKLNYYVGRSWIKNSRVKYKNPDAPKNEIIFNESLINWNGDIYLTEGVFDAMFLPNSIPLLGKYVSEKLLNALYEKSGGYVIIALDGDAYDNALSLYRILNGGRLFGRIKIAKLPKDKDVADLRGEISDFLLDLK
jgi:DNA primase